MYIYREKEREREGGRERGREGDPKPQPLTVRECTARSIAGRGLGNVPARARPRRCRGGEAAGQVPRCTGFRAWSEGFRVWGGGFRVWGLGFRLWGALTEAYDYLI